MASVLLIFFFFSDASFLLYFIYIHDLFFLFLTQFVKFMVALTD